MLLLSSLNFLLLVFLLFSGVCSHVLEEGDGGPTADVGGTDEKGGMGQDVAKLENLLGKSWQELDRMLYCTKRPLCVIRYNKVFRIGNQNVRADLHQSLTLTLHQIKDITNKLQNIKRLKKTFSQTGRDISIMLVRRQWRTEPFIG